MKKLIVMLLAGIMILSMGAAAVWAGQEAPAAFEDGTYTAEVTMEGGSGRASIQSPARIIVEDGQVSCLVVWRSDKYDYMIVDGTKYDPVTTEGGSRFLIPVATFDEPLAVIGDTVAMSQPHEVEYTFTFDSASMAPLPEDGVYTAEFNTDSSMFHVNEAYEGKGILTVKDGEMTIHISLVSKNIVNLFPGLAEDAQKEGAILLEPTVDPVTYSDGFSEEVFGFDVPVPSIGNEFDLAILGKKGEWYDHKVSVCNPVPAE